MIAAKAIKTVKSGKEYRVTLDNDGVEEKFTFILSSDAPAVFVYGRNRTLGGFYLVRFGGRLDPEGIRLFVKNVMNGSTK